MSASDEPSHVMALEGTNLRVCWRPLPPPLSFYPNDLGRVRSPPYAAAKPPPGAISPSLAVLAPRRTAVPACLILWFFALSSIALLGCAPVDGSGLGGEAKRSAFQLDQFSRDHFYADELTYQRLEDGALLGQFSIVNKTDERVSFQYKWLWLNEEGISVDHGSQAWKTRALEAAAEQIVESRIDSAQAVGSLIRIRERPRFSKGDRD